MQPPLLWLAVKSGHPFRVDTYAQLVGAVAATALMLRLVDQHGWGAIDLARSAANVRAFVVGWCAGGFTITIACATLFILGMFRFLPAASSTTWLGAAVRATLILLPAAMAEELICRGYVLTVIRDSAGARIAVVTTSVIFGLLHLANPGATAMSVTVVTLSGICLATIRLAMNSLYAAWMAHFAWNWVMAVPLHAPVSGIDFEAPWYRAVTSGPAWISGGTWGPEGGLVAALGMLAGLAFFYARRRREES